MRRRTWQAAKSLEELQASDDSGISEWGNPVKVKALTIYASRGITRGTETS